jgi:hypothetical protein
MSCRNVMSLAAVAILGITCISTDALAWRGGGVRVGGAYRGGAVAWRGPNGGGAVAVRGGVYGGRYWRPGVGVAAAGVAVGAAAATAPYYYRGGPCGYYPYPACY